MLHASDILQKGLKTVGITVYLIFIALRYSVYKMHYNSYANSNNKSNGKKTLKIASSQNAANMYDPLAYPDPYLRRCGEPFPLSLSFCILFHDRGLKLFCARTVWHVSAGNEDQDRDPNPNALFIRLVMSSEKIFDNGRELKTKHWLAVQWSIRGKVYLLIF